MFSVVELRPCKSWWKVWVAARNGSASICPVRASLRFMSLKTVLSIWAQPLSSVQEMNFAIQRMSSHLVLFSTCTRPASQGQRWKAWLLGSKEYNIIVTTISHTHARTHTWRRPQENIPQQQRAGLHEHPEETTLTSWQIKPSQRLH